MLLNLNGRMVDLQRGSVTDAAGNSIATLRPQAAEILQVLAAKCGEIVTKDELMQTVWGNIAVSDDSLVQCVIEIRKALGDGKHRIIRTLPKRGYVLETNATDDSRNRNATGVLPATPRRGSWIGPAAGLGVLAMAAVVYFWPAEPDGLAIAALPVENTNGDPAGALNDMAVRERAKVAEEDLLAAHREIDRLRSSVQTARSAREEALRRELDSIRRSAYLTGAPVRAVAEEKAAQGRAFEEQRQRADQLAGTLALTQREVEHLKAEAVQQREAAEISLAQAKRAFDEERQRADQLAGTLALTQREVEHLKAEAVQQREAAEISLAQAKRALEQQRQKVGLLERDLAVAHQSIEALEASARVAATVQATATQRRQADEAALMRTGEALALERKRTESLTRELDTTRLEHSAAKDHAVRVSTAMDEALEQERERATSLARGLTAARNQIDILPRPSPRLQPASKARDTKSASQRARPARKLVSQEIRKAEVRKSSRPVISLPAALLPVQ